MARIVEGPEGIAEGARVLSGGGVVAFPTETVYGLGALALDADAVARVFAMKGRPSENPLIVHVSGEGMARRFVADWTERAAALARGVWPGSVTMVLAKGGSVPGVVTAGGATVAVRCPAHPVALALIETLGEPIVGPSANVSGMVSPTRADHVARAFGGEDLVVIDGGACRAGIESTVVDLTGDRVRVLRPGVVSAAEIARILGESVDDADGAGVDASGGVVASPGLIGAHYRPRTVLRIVGLDEAASAKEDVCVIAHGALETRGARVIDLGSDARGYAAAIYAALHDADAMGVREILVVELPGADRDPIWGALRERLGRASR
jgi:L-threonylcarbamoyladenylate synthase